MGRFVLLAGLACGSAVAAAQGHESSYAGPWRTVSDGADDQLAQMGHNALAYFSQNSAVPGGSCHHEAEFLTSPDKHMPQFGRLCTNGINCAIPWAAGRAAVLKPRLEPGLTSRLARGVALLYAGLHLPAHPWRR